MSKIFVSYSHKDETWKDHLLPHLRVLQLWKSVDIWDDRRSLAGDAWQDDIERQIDSAKVAVLLVSANFLTSKFILGEELPRIFKRQSDAGLRIIPLIVKPCAWRAVPWLTDLQGRPKDNRALSGTDEHQMDTDLAALAMEIHDILSNNEYSSVSTKSPVTERRINLEERFRRDCWDAYQRTTETDKFDRLSLDTDDEIAIVNALHPILSRHNYFIVDDLSQKTVDCKTGVLEVVTHHVATKMRQQKMYKAIHVVNSIAEQICRDFIVELYDERKLIVTDAKILEQNSSTTADKRRNARENCNITIEIKHGVGKLLTVKVLNQSRNGIGFLSPERLSIKELIETTGVASKHLPFALPKQFSIVRNQWDKEGYYYGARASV